MVSKNFVKGQYVVYATNGLCCVEDIKYISFISGEKEKLHYILKPVKGFSSIYFIAKSQNFRAAGDMESSGGTAMPISTFWGGDNSINRTLLPALLSLDSI